MFLFDSAYKYRSHKSQYPLELTTLRQASNYPTELYSKTKKRTEKLDLGIKIKKIKPAYHYPGELTSGKQASNYPTELYSEKPAHQSARKKHKKQHHIDLGSKIRKTYPTEL